MTMSTFQGVGRTTLVSRANKVAEAGGIARFFKGLSSVDCSAISWVGEDEMSEAWRLHLSEMGVDATYVEVLPGAMPTSFLMHGTAGETLTFFDPGILGKPSYQLGERARQCVSSSDLLVLAVSPAQATSDALDVVSAGTTVVWVVKADPQAYPIELRRRILERADLIILSHQEEGFLAGVDASSRAAIVLTAGSAPVTWTNGESQGICKVQPIQGVLNTTGAGDVFAGHVIGVWSRGIELSEAVEAGISSSYEYLSSRVRKPEV